MPIENVLLVGAQGGFGRLLARRIAELGVAVSGVARRPRDEELQSLAAYHQADALTLDDDYRALVNAADCIIVCLPDEPTRAVVPLLAAEMSAGAMLCDVLSVKTPIAEIMADQRDDIELVSLHPMFAPAVDFPGQNVVVIPVRAGERAEVLNEWLTRWQAHITTMTADEHDRLAAMTQTATHAAVLTFGLTLARLGYKPDAAEPTSTPAHRSLLAQLARIAGSDAEVYWKILHDNPASGDVLANMNEALGDLQKLATDGSERQLADVLAEIRGLLGDRQQAMFDRSTKLFEVDAQERRQTE